MIGRDKVRDLALPDDAAAAAASDALESLAGFLRAHPTSSARVALVAEGGERAEVVVAGEVFRLLIDMLEHVSRGDAVTVASVQAELTTQQSADLLNVSRPHLIKLLEEGKIPHRRVGNRRKVRLLDVLAYRQHDEQRHHAALDELIREAEELGLYDEEGPFEPIRRQA
jgi:excisionase family DNA binding protein